MKKIKPVLTAIALLLTTSLFAQDIPKKEFTISTNESSIGIAPGEIKRVEVNVNRSKSYRKTKIDLILGSTLPEGITISFEDGTNPINDRVMIISTTPAIQPFQKTIIIKGRSSRISKGIMIDLHVDAQTISAN